MEEEESGSHSFSLNEIENENQRERKRENWKTHKNQKSIGRLQFMSVLVFLNRTA